MLIKIILNKETKKYFTSILKTIKKKIIDINNYSKKKHYNLIYQSFVKICCQRTILKSLTALSLINISPYFLILFFKGNTNENSVAWDLIFSS